jgi:hypothetical protein
MHNATLALSLDVAYFKLFATSTGKGLRRKNTMMKWRKNTMMKPFIKNIQLLCAGEIVIE